MGLGAAAVTRTVALMAGVLVAGAATGVSFATQDVAMTMSEPAENPLRIEGSVSGVVPGKQATLTLTLRNGAGEPRAVSRVRADVTGVADGPRHCDGDYLTAGEWNGVVAVPARGSATVTVPVVLSPDLPADCASVAWGLAYTAY